jgi:hypothetical protein
MKLVRLSKHLLVNVDNVKYMQIAKHYDSVYLYIDNEPVAAVQEDDWERGEKVLDLIEEQCKEDNDKELWQD